MKTIGPKITEYDINILEDKYSISFPNDYKKFLLKFNGGIVENTYFFYDDDAIVLNFILSIKQEKLNLEEYIQDYTIKEIISSNFIPIAEDVFGNLVCLYISINQPDYGKAYFWSHEFPEDGMRFVANSFSEFFNGLSDKR